MPPFASLPLRAAFVAGLLLVADTSGPLAQQRVGIHGAVNPEATGAPPGAAPKKLVIGQEVIFNERIVTDTGGQTQIMFLDESGMTVGPNSDLTIDQFVYDPKSGTGKLAMSATRGLLRYVGGKLSKQDGAVTVRTSTATLAVRGGAFIMNIDNSGKTEAIFIFGEGLSVTGLNGIGGTLRRPGFEIVVVPGGAAPSAPFPVPPEHLAQLLQQLDGRRGGSGGASVIPTDATVVGSGIAQTISGNLPFTFGPQLVSPNANAVQQSQINALNPSATTNPPAPVPAPPVSSAISGRIKNTNGGGTARGFVDQSANGDIAYTGTLTNGVFTATIGNFGTISFPLAPTPGGPVGFTGLSTTLGTFSGTAFMSADGSFFYANAIPSSAPSERIFIEGGTPVNSSFYQTTGSGLRPQTGSNTRVFAFTVQTDGALQSNIPFIRSQIGGNLANAAVSPLYVVAPATTKIGDASTGAATRALQGSLAIEGQGANQRSAIAVTAGTIGSLQSSGLPTLSGAMRGSALVASGNPVALRSSVSSMVDANGNSFYGTDAISGFALDQSSSTLNSSGVVSNPTAATASEVGLSGTTTTYGFAQAAISSAVPTVNGSTVGTNRTTQALSGNFGGLMYTTAQTAPYIVTGGSLVSTDAATNRVQATLAGAAQSTSAGVTNLTMQYGGLAGASGSQAFVDDSTFAALESATNSQQLTINGTTSQPTGQLYLMSSGVATPPDSLLPSGASYCQCQFLQWGYWGGDLTTPSTTGGASRIDRGHINFWVAGLPTQLNELSTLQGQGATASYTGHAIGSVYNNGASYIAAGGFTGSYNFGTQSGTMAVNNFDGRSFSATGKAPLNGANYSFSVNSPGVTGAINGTFYGTKAAETGGSFAVQTTVGPTYLASGIYAGKQ